MELIDLYIYALLLFVFLLIFDDYVTYGIFSVLIRSGTRCSLILKLGLLASGLLLPSLLGNLMISLSSRLLRLVVLPGLEQLLKKNPC